MSRKIAFVFSDSDIEKAADGNFSIFPLNPQLKLFLSKRNIKYFALEDYFRKKEKEAIENLASLWASNWYIGRNDIFKHLRLSMHNYFSKTLFMINCLDSVIDKESVGSVFLGKEVQGKAGFLRSHFESVSPLVKLVCATKKIDLLDYSQKENRLLKQIVQFAVFPRLVKIEINARRKFPIFFASNHYHIKSCLPLLKKLNSTTATKPIIFGKIGIAEPDLKKEEIEYINYNGEIELGLLPRYFFLKLKLLIQFLGDTDIKKSYKYKGFDLSGVFKFKIGSLFLQEAPQLRSSQESIFRLLKKLEPKSVITVTNDSIMQVVVNTAKDLGIKNTELQHGLTFGLDAKYSSADNIIAWGKFSKLIYEKILKKKIHIGGWPEFQRYKNLKVLKKKYSGKILYLAHDPQGISTVYETMSVDKSYKIFLGAVSNLKNALVRIRLHPRAEKSTPLAIAQKYGVRVEFSRNKSLKEDLAWSDVVIGQTTAASIYALLFKKPLIYLASMKFPIRFLEKTGAVFEVRGSEDLIAKIELIKARGLTRAMNKKIEEFMNQYCNFRNNSINTISRLIRPVNDD